MPESPRSWPAITIIVAAIVAGLTACGSPERISSTEVVSPPLATAPQSTAPQSTPPQSIRSGSNTSPAQAPAPEETTPIRLRLERRVNDATTDDFATRVEAVLTDGRGWVQAGFEFIFAPPYEDDIQLTCGPDGPLG